MVAIKKYPGCNSCRSQNRSPMFADSQCTWMRKQARVQRLKTYLFKTQFLKQLHSAQPHCSGAGISPAFKHLFLFHVTWELFYSLMFKPLEQQTNSCLHSSQSPGTSRFLSSHLSLLSSQHTLCSPIGSGISQDPTRPLCFTGSE